MQLLYCHPFDPSQWRFFQEFIKQIWLLDVWKSQRQVLPALRSLCNTRPYGNNRMSAGGGRIIIGRRDLHQCIIKIIIQRERDSITLTNQRPCLWMAKFVVYLLGADEIIFGLTSLGWMQILYLTSSNNFSSCLVLNPCFHRQESLVKKERHYYRFKNQDICLTGQDYQGFFFRFWHSQESFGSEELNPLVGLPGNWHPQAFSFWKCKFWFKNILFYVYIVRRNRSFWDVVTANMSS